MNDILIGIAILVPALLFIAASWLNRVDVLDEATSTSERISAIMDEQARNVFNTANLVLERVADHIETDTDVQVAAPATSNFLRTLKAPLDEIVSIWISDAQGDVLAGSQDWDHTMKIAGREFFEIHRKQDVGIYISSAFVGKATNISSFAVSRRRPTADGHFAGTIHVALSPDFFSRFYAEAAPALPHEAMLVRADGQVLARDPPHAPVQLEAATPLMRQVASWNGRSNLTLRSPIDGVERLYSIRKVSREPVYVVYGTDKTAVMDRWWKNIMFYGMGTGVAALALLAVSALAVRRTRSEQRALLSLADESRQRLVVEQRLRQSQKMEGIGQLTGGIAHDFNNLLAVILGSLDLLRRGPKDEARARKLLDGAIQGAERGAILTKRLLAFARQQELDPQTVDLRELATGMVDLIKQSLAANFHLRLEFPPLLPSVNADPNQLELALLNLVLNARDAMPNGGEIVISGSQGDFAPGNDLNLRPGPYCCIRVTDTGIGMDETTLLRATEPFFTKKGIGKGTGLGLSMIHGFAVQSCGGLRLTSAQNAGTSIEIWLPVQQGEKILPPAVPSPPKLERSLRILLVDDDDLIRNSIVDMLDDLGHEVIEAQGAQQALSLLESNASMDVVLTDYAMPQMNGLELARQIKTRWPRLPILIISGNIDLNELTDEAVPGLMKPFDQRHLSQAIERLMAERKTQGV